MNIVGSLLFVVGLFVAGVFASRVVPPDVPEGAQASYSARIGAWWDAAGIGFSAGALMMVGGGLLARRARAASVEAESATSGGQSAPALMDTIRDRLADLPEDPTADGLKEQLEEILEELIPQVLDQREALIAQLELGPFAEMIGHFATMERNTARAWSALTDGVHAEIPPCLDRARAGMDRALAAMETAS
ncbi:MAG: hypothetical protein AB8I08_07020 [Sandaracinaceae bacterium]